MKTYQIVVRTSYYKTIEIEAENEAKARSAAWDYLGDNDPTKDAEVDIDLHDIEEVTG
jgi:hypothetical protein